MATPQPQTFGQLLKRYRLAARLTQEQLGERSRVSAHTISDLERGLLRVPYKNTIKQLADALHLAPPERARFEAAAGRQRSPDPPLPHPTPLPLIHGAIPPLVGRQQERLALESLLADDSAPLLLLAGEPGIGKTRLLDEAAARAREAGWCVLAGGCQRRGGQEPYAPLVGALAGHLAHQSPPQQRAHLHGCAWLVRLLPELGETAVVPAPTWTPPPADEQRLMFAAVGRYLANVAGPAGTLLLLDDLQWAGGDALDLLSALVRAESERPLRVVGAYRSTEVRAADPLAVLLADLAREGRAAQLAVGPLAAPEAAALLAGLLEGSEGVDAALAAQVLERAEGVPFFLLSCAQGLRAGALGEGAAGPELGIPWNVAQTIRQRVAALPEAAQELLGAAAVIGRQAPRAILLAVMARGAGWGQREWLEAVEHACQAGLLVEVETKTYAFAHDLIREAVGASLSTARRALLHGAVAAALEEMPEPKRKRERLAAELAYHFLQAEEPARALPYTLTAGDQAEAMYAHAEAERHYHTALELASELGDQAREAEALEKLGGVVKVLGRLDGAFELLKRSINGYQAVEDRAGELRALAALLPIYGARGVPDEGAARAQATLGVVEAQDTGKLSPALATVYISLANLYFQCGRPQDQLMAAKRAEERAQAAGDDTLLARALHWRHLAATSLRRDEERVDLHELIALAERAGETWVVAKSLNHVAWDHLVSGEFAQGRPYLARAVEVAEQRHDPGLIAQMWIGAGELSYYLGEWERAQDEFARAASIQHELDQFSASWGSAYPPLYLGTLDVAQGRVEEGEQRLQLAIGLAGPIGDPQALVFAGKILAECDLLAGHAADARARLTWLGERCMQAQEWVVNVLRPLMAWAELELGSLKEAAAELTPIVERLLPLWRVDALRVQALLAIKEERWQDGEQTLDQIIEMTHAMPYPYAEVKALSVYGQLHTAKGEPELAREKYEQALAICERLGERLYRPHIERALAE